MNPIAMIGFPEALKVKDVEKAIGLAKNVEAVLAAGPKKSYMAQMGYLEFEGFEASLPECNPLVRYALWEAISQGAGTLCAPSQYSASIEKWRAGGIDVFNNDFTVSQLKKKVAFASFAFLIVLVIDLIVESGANAFL